MSLFSLELSRCGTVEEKIAFLDTLPEVVSFVFPKDLTREEECALKQWVAIGQHKRVASHPEALASILPHLVAVDRFYRELGGLIGYHERVLALLKAGDATEQTDAVFHPPFFFDISEPTEEVLSAISWGIEAMPETVEIYPLGGAADRLHLVDAATGEELPAAKLKLAGRTLFERLIRDLFAREFLYFLTYGKQVVTPIAIMTSPEKNNHLHVRQILESHDWFHRPQEMFRLFTQPLVPVLDEEGQWCWSGAERLLLKPGGHGVLWKLLRDEGIFDWFEGLKMRKALIRQINNPAAGIDYGLLAFVGVGWKKNMKFGFASCPRRLLAAEGVNVLIERKREGTRTLVLTNIEYCDFAKMGIEDKPLREGDSHSRFPSNTNILFADLASVREVIDEHPLPGLLLNLKQGLSMDERGQMCEKRMARLESTMQNIADVFVEDLVASEELLQKVLDVAKGEVRHATKHTFATYNHRHKTISTSKRAYVPGKSLQETPENCFFEQMGAARELLTRCQYRLPPLRSLEEHLERGPEFAFLYHPALGPLYSIIEAKLQKGELACGSELELEISDLVLKALRLDGSLRILADQVMGHLEQGQLRFSPWRGRCVLEEVTVLNRGVDWSRSRPVWRGDWHREETVEIVLRGHSEFVAKGVVFRGSHRFEVEEGTRLIVEQVGSEWVQRKEPLGGIIGWHHSSIVAGRSGG